MKYPFIDQRVTGALLPLAALRSQTSIGCGEFADLPAFAAWAADAGLTLIQLLPVNDSGGQSSPYSALSAFALHPMYLRIQDTPEYAALGTAERSGVDASIDAAAAELDSAIRFDYDAVVRHKLTIARAVFDAAGANATQELTAFMRTQPWVKPYAVFRALKTVNQERAWTEWEDPSPATQEMIDRAWKGKSLQAATRFYAWLQLRLDQQFQSASQQVHAAGVALKGDLPILMNEDSVDAWCNPDIFRTELRAGAPPDMFSHEGQNWGFPIYDWNGLAQRDYDWWRSRLAVAARYYSAYRIDHVLGFFRIWAIRDAERSGVLGAFWPQHGMTYDDLRGIGFDDGRIRWLCEPHLTGDQLRSALGPDWRARIGTAFSQLAGEDLYRFSETIGGERDIESLEIAPEQQAWLVEQWRDRALVKLPDGSYAPTWRFRECSRYVYIADWEKSNFENLVAERGSASNEQWAAHGHTILSVLRESSDMLPCAEDLGVIPEAVPRVLQQLGVYSLYVPRWAHYWDREGQPAIPLHEYRGQSVCATSVHDTSTLREWWERETGREILWSAIGREDPCPPSFDPHTAQVVLAGLARCASHILVFQIQDLLATSAVSAGIDPAAERVNIPGTYDRFNWTWRMPLGVEELATMNDIKRTIRDIVANRIS